MSLAAYIAFYSNDIQERTADGLICKRPAGNTYKIQDDAWALDFYYAHKDDTAAQLVHAVLTNTQMWDQDLTKIEGLEAAVLADLEMIRTQVPRLLTRAACKLKINLPAQQSCCFGQQPFCAIR